MHKITKIIILIIFINIYSFIRPFILEAADNCKISDMSYEQAMKQNKPVAIEFYADWCGYCKKFAPLYEDLKAQYSDKIIFLKINTDKPETSYLSSKYNITSLPSVIIINPKSDEWHFIPQGYYFDMELMKEQLEKHIE